jgi:hypothetical protein
LFFWRVEIFFLKRVEVVTCVSRNFFLERESLRAIEKRVQRILLAVSASSPWTQRRRAAARYRQREVKE